MGIILLSPQRKKQSTRIYPNGNLNMQQMGDIGSTD